MLEVRHALLHRQMQRIRRIQLNNVRSADRAAIPIIALKPRHFQRLSRNDWRRENLRKGVERLAEGLMRVGDLLRKRNNSENLDDRCDLQRGTARNEERRREINGTRLGRRGGRRDKPEKIRVAGLRFGLDNHPNQLVSFDF